MTPRWMKRLSTPGACLLKESEAGYAVYPRGDRRRRPIARVRRDEVEEARADGLLSRSGDGYILSPEAERAGVREATGPNGFLFQHGGTEKTAIVEPGGRVETHVRHGGYSPLTRWARPGPDGSTPLIDRAEFEAGEKLRADHARSTMSQRMTADWTAPPRSKSGRSASGPEDAPIAAMAARDRVMSALEAIGPGLDRVVFAACIRETGLSQIEREESWPKRSGKIALKLGLTRLAVHYGMKRAQAASASL